MFIWCRAEFKIFEHISWCDQSFAFTKIHLLPLLANSGNVFFVFTINQRCSQKFLLGRGLAFTESTSRAPAGSRSSTPGEGLVPKSAEADEFCILTHCFRDFFVYTLALQQPIFYVKFFPPWLRNGVWTRNPLHTDLTLQINLMMLTSSPRSASFGVS